MAMESETNEEYSPLAVYLEQGEDALEEKIYNELKAEYEAKEQDDSQDYDIDEKLEQMAEDRLKNVLNSLDDDELYNIVYDNMTIERNEGESTQDLVKRGKDSVLYTDSSAGDDYARVLPDLITGATAQDVVQKKIINRIQKKYRALAGLPKSVLERQVSYLFSKAISTDVKGKKRTVKETREHVGTLGRKQQREKGASMDKGRMSSILRNFYLRSSGKRLTFATVFDNDWKPKEVNLKTAAMYRIPTESKINELIGEIQLYDMRIQNTLDPLVDLLQFYLRNEGMIVEFEADAFIGSYDLKKLQRREALYDYWADKSRQYKRFKDAFAEFHEAIGDLEMKPDNEGGKEFREVIFKLLDFKKEIDAGNLNYIVKFKPLSLETYFSEDKGWILFEKLGKEIGFFEDFDAKQLAEEISSQDTKREKQTANVFRRDDFGGTLEGKKTEYMADTMDTGIGTKGEEKVSGGLSNELQQLSDLGIMIDGLDNVEVDPLYYHAFKQEGAIFKDTVVFARELEHIRAAMEGAGAARELIDGVDLDDDILDYIKELKKYAAIQSRKGGFHLPLQKTTKKFIVDLQKDFSIEDVIDSDRGEGKHLDERLKKIGEFIDTLSKVLDSGKDLSRSASPSISESKDTSSGPQQNQPKVDKPELGRGAFTSTQFLGRLNEKNLLEEINDARKEFDELLDEVISFFIIPLSGDKAPFDDPIPFEFKDSNAPRYFKMLAGGKKPDSVFFHAMMMEQRKGALMINKGSLEKLVTNLEFITKPGEQKDLPSLTQAFKEMGKTVNWILKLKNKSTLGKEVFTELGAHLHAILEDNDMSWPDDAVFPSGASWGKTPEEWHEDYVRAGDAVWPVVFISNHLKTKRESYSQNPRTQAKGQDKKARGADTLVQRFFNAIDDMKLTRSMEQLTVLQAHDEIRKMMNKPVYYNTAKVDNYDHVSAAIKKLEEKYNVNVSAFEIESIVEEMGSMADIGKKHGIPTEGVYFVKANFR